VLRALFLVPLVGDRTARQIGVPVGSLLVFAVAYLCVRWIAAGTTAQLLDIGLLWVVLTVLFEIGLGRLVLELPWDRHHRGPRPSPWRLPGLGLSFMAVSPLLAARIPGQRRRSPPHHRCQIRPGLQ